MPTRTEIDAAYERFLAYIKLQADYEHDQSAEMQLGLAQDMELLAREYLALRLRVEALDAQARRDRETIDNLQATLGHTQDMCHHYRQQLPGYHEMGQ